MHAEWRALKEGATLSSAGHASRFRFDMPGSASASKSQATQDNQRLAQDSEITAYCIAHTHTLWVEVHDRGCRRGCGCSDTLCA
eukprot:3789438-Amphidinium_carterae.1